MKFICDFFWAWGIQVCNDCNKCIDILDDNVEQTSKNNIQRHKVEYSQIPQRDEEQPQQPLSPTNYIIIN
jgi:hypothetical protein